MLRLVILLVVAATFCDTSPVGEKKLPCIGCPKELDPNDADIIKSARSALEQINSDERLANIVSVNTRGIFGRQIEAIIMSESGKRCKLIWIEEDWVSALPLRVRFDCNPADKLGATEPETTTTAASKPGA